MERVQVRKLMTCDQTGVVGETPTTAGFWYYAGFFYASPAMLAERRSRTT